MRFKHLLWVGLLCGCTNMAGKGGGTVPGDNVVGKPLKAVTEMSDPNASDRTNIVLFDRTVRMIHQFDLSTMSVVRSLDVDAPDVSHSVLFDQPTGLILDFTPGHMTLFDRASSRYRDPLSMAGKAQSYAYANGTLVLYDDLNTVGLAHVGPDGAPTSVWAGGPLLQNDEVLTAGDLLDDGSLVLALSSGTLARVDVTATLAQQQWVFTSVTTSLGRISWLAPVHGHNDRVLVKTETQVALVSLTSGSVISAVSLASYGHVTFESKTRDAHVIAQTASNLSLIYTDGVSVHVLPLNASPEVILASRLCISENSWSLLTSKLETSWTYRQGEIEGKDRSLSKYRLQDLYPMARFALPDTAQLDVSGRYVFALYPSELGYGVRMNVSDGGGRAVIKMFNAGHIH